jgi:hypothetical protein
MARRGELVALDLENFTFWPDGTGRVLIRRSKTDQAGEGQHLLALNIDLASVMQAGRWKSNRMPMRYGEYVLAARGGMARAAKEQGRS